jgi:hypothetical protein
MESTGLWAAPLLLIPGVGLLVLSTSARFGQLHEELHRQRGEGHSLAVKHLCRRARLLHSALVSFYVSIAVLAFSSLLGTLANRWFETLKWIPEMMTFLGVAVITFAAIQLIRESKLLITVVLDDAERESTSQ